MKKVTLIAIALTCAFLVAGTVSAQPQFSAGLSPELAIPHPITEATLRADANRLIRWQGWLNVDAFSVSVLAQMQKQLGVSIELGKFTLDEESIADAVRKASKSPTFQMNEYLKEGENLRDVKLYVWTYRHNHADTGLYQLYISARGKMLIGEDWLPGGGPPVPHRDIQALGYEFGNDGQGPGTRRKVDVIADVEIWRGAVVRVNARGEITMVGNEAGAVPLVGGVEVVPMAEWERAPSLIGNWNYNPVCATGAPYWNPLDHASAINSNLHQLRPGDVRLHPEAPLGVRSTTTSPPYQPLSQPRRIGKLFAR